VIAIASSSYRAGRRILFAAGMAILNLALSVQPARAQGCVVARSNGEVGGPQSEGGYLQPGEFDINTGYRHQFSFRHFVGPVEQTYRIEQGTQVMNKINLENFAVTYQLTSRYSVTADVPLLLASRHTHNSPITYTAQGIGDVSFLAQGWIWNPKENTRGNVQLSMGVLLPTGRNHLTNVVDAFDGKGPQTRVLDYSVQPGQGGWGLPLQWIAYKNVRSNQLYFNGSYLAMFKSINSVLRSSTANPLTLTQYNAISDQYLMEAGIAHPISRVKGLTVTFGPRMEGVPARNLFPADNLGFRRPGFAISLEPGVQYVHGRHVFTAQVGKAIHRDRTRSVPDILTGGHGDAAFADYVWLASYSFRFSRHGSAGSHHQTDDLSSQAAPVHSGEATLNP
jgi:hypothetical protein